MRERVTLSLVGKDLLPGGRDKGNTAWRNYGDGGQGPFLPGFLQGKKSPGKEKLRETDKFESSNYVLPVSG